MLLILLALAVTVAVMESKVDKAQSEIGVSRDEAEPSPPVQAAKKLRQVPDGSPSDWGVDKAKEVVDKELLIGESSSYVLDCLGSPNWVPEDRSGEWLYLVQPGYWPFAEHVVMFVVLGPDHKVSAVSVADISPDILSLYIKQTD